MKKFIPLLVIIGLLLTTTLVVAAPKKSVFVIWRGGDNEGYFFTNPSGLVLTWTTKHYRPEFNDKTHWVIKPKDKFPNATCDATALYTNYNWSPRAMVNTAISLEYKEAFEEVFPNLDKIYTLCIYPTQ